MPPWRLVRRQFQRPRQVAAVPPPAALYEVTYACPGLRHTPVTVFDQHAALDAARRMSAQGELVDVTLVLDGVSRRLIASFTCGQLLLGATARVPAAADAALALVIRLRGTGDVRAAARQYPDGISPLPVAAMSGGPLRPSRLLFPDGTRLDCRPGGCSGPSRTGTADGVVPAGGDLAPGWLQVIRLDDIEHGGGLVTVHPALVSPGQVDPYACLRIRQRHRFGEFDAAEADGRITARLRAGLVDAGDLICARQHDISQISQVTHACGAPGVSVRITADSLCGSTGTWTYQACDLVEIMIPARHPAEHGPQAQRLFAPPQTARTIPARSVLLPENAHARRDGGPSAS